MQLSVQNISKSYELPNGDQRAVLKELNLSVQKGDRIAIIGPSGSGKSTLLNILGLMDKANSGEIMFEGNNILEYKEKEQLIYRNTKVGFVFQQHHLLPQCTLLENILLPTLVNKSADTHEFEEKAESLMKDLGIWELKQQKPNAISVGEAQRGAIARALINSPSIILADEPSGSLDHQNTDQLADLLLDVNAEHGVSLIVVTHSLGFAERMDTIYELENGQLKRYK
jgi:ABC-type lipoprotein export system ATPase subunit